MKTVIQYKFILGLLFSTALSAQKVGIGTISPQYDLDVNGRMRLKLTNNETSKIIITNISNQAICNIWHNDDNHIGFYLPGTTGSWEMVMNVNNGNIGLGTLFPEYKIDLNGRMRIQHDTSTAGIWFDGTTQPTRSFVGSIDNDHVGIFGNGGADWGFAMNVNSGNVGIGTSTPTAELDVDGDIRIRTLAVKGAVLTSYDNLGNAQWQNPSVFKVKGTAGNVPFPINNLTWTKVLFNETPSYNVGLNYNPATSEIEINTRGIYNFKTAFQFLETAGSQSVRIMLKRNNVVSTIGEMYFQRVWWYQDENTNGWGNFRDVENLSVMGDLLPGDVIWVEAFIELNNSGGTDTQITEDPTRTWFTGKLISRT